MTQKEQAKELINLFYYTDAHTNSIKIRMQIAIDSAVTCVTQIIKHRPTFPMHWDEHGEPIAQLDWWKEVLNEIKNYDITKIS